MRTIRSMAIAAALCGLGACGQAPAPSEPATRVPPAPAPAAAAAPPTSGVDKSGIDPAVKPGDDFDAYANGGWRAKTAIPDDRASTGAFFHVFQTAEQRNAELVQGLTADQPAAGSDARKIADDYAAYMDEAGIEQRGIAPLKPALDAIAAIVDKTALAQALGAGLRADVDPLNATHYTTDRLFGLFVAQGLDDPEHNLGYLMQGGLGMPDRDYYLSSDKAMADVRGQYKTYIAALLKQAGIADAEKKAAAIYALEDRIARAHVAITETQDVHKANNPWPTAEFARRAPGLDWSTYFKAAGLDGQTRIDAWQPEAITRLSALVASQPLDAWKQWLTFHAIDRASGGLLPKAFDDLHFGFHGTALNGTPKQRDRWKRALGRVNTDLGDAVGKLYAEKYFPESSRKQVQRMVDNLLAVFPERIDKLDWMDADTKARAKEKVATMRVGVGYPDRWRDYSALQIESDDPLGNAERAEYAEYLHQRGKLGRTPDRDEWWMTPQTVNAVNLPLQNALNFPAAFMEPPFFDPKADAAANYGSMGATIGHEISHGFDDTGAEFDAQGRLRNWWTPADAAHFKAAGDKLAAQYDGYEALPGLHVKGRQTLGENIADLAGLAVSYDAYVKSLGGKPAPVIDGLTGDQRFFLAYAQSWREKTRDAALRAQIVGDGHAPGRFRAQTVRNLDAWYGAYDAKPVEALYLEPKDRIKVW